MLINYGTAVICLWTR